MELPVVPQCEKVRKPPLEAAPQSATVLVDTEAQTGVLILEVEVLDEVDLFHSLPTSRKAEAGEHGAEDDEGVEDGEEEDEDVSELEGEDDASVGAGCSLIDDEAE